MSKQGVTRILIAHFFRRFFDNDTIQADGDTQTTVVRAIAIVAAPGLLISFFLQNKYPKPMWSAIVDHYFFVLFSFVVMGVVTIFEWEMLFPDRLDFLILSPLSVKPLQMLFAKAAALLGFISLFLVSCNAFAMVILPAVSKGDFFRHLFAHAVAVLSAGLFGALLFLAISGALLCVLSAQLFRVVSPLAQMLSVLFLILQALYYAKYANSTQYLLTGSLGMAHFMPPLWFLGMYEVALHGAIAPAFAREMQHCAVWGIVIAATLVSMAYPIAWARMRRMAIEGAASKRGEPSRSLARLMHRIAPQPAERAMFHFIGQTITRNSRNQVYLAMYSGTGLALAAACAITLHLNEGRIRPTLSVIGLHALMPLLLFWLIAGLRVAFAFPMNLPAGWAFRITGVSLDECAAAERKWVLLCAMSLMSSIVGALYLAGWNTVHLFVQTVIGLCLCVLLTELFFFSQQNVPFNRPRMPGRTNFPLMVTLYVGILPLYIYGVVALEWQIEKNLSILMLVGAVVAGLHIALAKLRIKPEIPEEMEGYESEFQLLGLS